MLMYIIVIYCRKAMLKVFVLVYANCKQNLVTQRRILPLLMLQ